MNDGYILAYDVGTSGVKAALVRQDGSVEDSVTKNHTTKNLAGGISEQDPVSWWNGVCESTCELAGRKPELTKNIEIIGVSGIMLGCVPVDNRGQALGNALIHSDFRAREQCKRLLSSVDQRTVYELTGNIPEARSSLCKMMWIRERAPQIYSKTAFFLQSKDYIVSKMTGNIGVTDYSDASQAQLLDIKRKSYACDLIKEAGLDVQKMPPLHKSTDIVGHLSGQAAGLMGLREGIPVIAGAGDGPCSGVGTGSVKPSQTYCCLGSTAWICSIAEAPFIDPGMRLFNIIAPDGINTGIYGTVQSACHSVEWAMSLFDETDVQHFHIDAQNSDPGAEGLVFLPYLDGERTPVFDPGARGVFFGVSSVHRKEHFKRAVLEGVSMALRQALDVFREKTCVGSLRMIGGGARSSIWKKMISDICKVPIKTIDIPPEYATSAGIAFVAGTGAGMFSSIEEAAGQVRDVETIYPDENTYAIYDSMYEKYIQLYPAVKNLFL